jgi:RNA polymerase sigma-70 factor (ECF subfamily)
MISPDDCALFLASVAKVAHFRSAFLSGNRQKSREIGAMPITSDPQTLLTLLRRGDEQAAQQVFDVYVNRLLKLARNRISQRLIRRVDPEDIVQSVFRTFFRRVKAGQLRIVEEDDLGRLLSCMTTRKALRQVAKHKAAKRDCSRDGDPDAPLVLEELPAKEPSPEVAVAFLDLLEHFLASLRPQDREILELRLEDYGTLEIAHILGTSDRHIRRALEHIRAIIKQDNLLT